VKQIRKRLTYANVMSSLALFLVLGGATAFAATKIGASQLKANSVKTGKIVKEAVTTSKIKNNAVNTSKIGDGAVTTTKIANEAVTGEKVLESSLGEVPSAAKATTATNAGSLAGKAGSEYAVRYFAKVEGSGATPTLIAGSPGVTVDPNRPFTGGARVHFPVDMTNCAIVASNVSGGGAVLVARQSSSLSEKNDVAIILEEAGGAGVNSDFNVIGIC
jgi:hypothetical protein